VRDLTGKTAVKAAGQAGDLQAETAREQAELTRQVGQEAAALQQPFADVGQRGVDLAGFLADPQAQFDFLQSNPLLQLSIDQAQQPLLRSAAAGGRASAGDTLQDLQQSALATGQGLIGQQRSDILNLLNLGQGTATAQGNLLTGQQAQAAGLETGGTAAEAAGIVGAANARGARANKILDIGKDAAQFAMFASDPRLKTNKKLIGEENGFNKWLWDWNELAYKEFGLSGSGFGVMADEVLEKRPDAIYYVNGFMQVNYDKIGVTHGR